VAADFRISPIWNTSFCVAALSPNQRIKSFHAIQRSLKDNHDHLASAFENDFSRRVCLASVSAVSVARAQNVTEIQLQLQGQEVHPAEISAPANTPIVIKFKNLEAKAMEFESKSLHIEKVVAAGGDAVINVSRAKARPLRIRREYNERSPAARWS